MSVGSWLEAVILAVGVMAFMSQPKATEINFFMVTAVIAIGFLILVHGLRITKEMLKVEPEKKKEPNFLKFNKETGKWVDENK